MPDSPRGPFRPAFLIATVKAAAAITVLSILAIHWLSSGVLDRPGLSRLAADATRPGFEPATTGSIRKAAETTRVDPCTGQAKR